MSTQPEALRLADLIERGRGDDVIYAKDAAAELRRLHQSEREGWRYADEVEQERKRLHEVNAELVEALRLIQPIQCDNLHHEKKHRHSYAESCPVKEWIDGVFAKAQGDNNG